MFICKSKHFVDVPDTHLPSSSNLKSITPPSASSFLTESVLLLYCTISAIFTYLRMSAIILKSPTSTPHLSLANTQFSTSLRIKPLKSSSYSVVSSSFLRIMSKTYSIRLLSTPLQYSSPCSGYQNIYKRTQSWFSSSFIHYCFSITFSASFLSSQTLSV